MRLLTSPILKMMHLLLGPQKGDHLVSDLQEHVQPLSQNQGENGIVCLPSLRYKIKQIYKRITTGVFCSDFRAKEKTLKYLVKQRCILQVLDILPLKEDGYTVSFGKIANIWPPEASYLCSFLQKLQTQFHCP